MGGVTTEVDKALRDDLAHSLSVFGKGKPSEVLDRLRKLEVYTFASACDGASDPVEGKDDLAGLGRSGGRTRCPGEGGSIQ